MVKNIKQEVKDNQQSKNKLSNSLTVVKEEITKRTQKSLNEFAKQHQEVKQPEKDQQHQLKI